MQFRSQCTMRHSGEELRKPLKFWRALRRGIIFPKEASPHEKFERLAKALIAVPKNELDKRQAAYERTKKTKKKRKAARP